MKEHTLPLLHAKRLSRREHLIVERGMTITDFASLTWTGLSQHRTPVMDRQEDLVIIGPGIRLRFYVQKTKLS